jgi:hypothetical protein
MVQCRADGVFVGGLYKGENNPTYLATFNSNFIEMYYSGRIGDIAKIDLPYVPGKVIGGNYANDRFAKTRAEWQAYYDALK